MKLSAKNRTRLYVSTAVLAVIACVALATVLTVGAVMRGQVDAWMKNLAYAVTVIAQGAAILSGAIAKMHVTPDE